VSRSTADGPYTVGGITDRSFPSLGMALNLAARRAELADDEIQMGVFKDGTRIGRVRRLPSGVVTIEAREDAGEEV
jgi:hypothetical protein